MRFEYIVVGGGSAGCVVAGRLAAGGKRVLLLERGPAAEQAPETLRADGYKDAFINDRIFFERFSEPQQHCAGRRVFLGTGSVLGGSGAVNGMVYTRGAREDYDEWPQGWRWEDVQADFESLEEQLHINQRPATQWTSACIEAAETRGFNHSQDFNDGQLYNAIGYEWMSYEGNQRRSSYVAFIRSAELGDRLTVVSGAQVQRIEVNEDRRACAVHYNRDGKSHRAVAEAEIILCAGALETPKLLMLSGIGPVTELEAHGIDVVADIAGIGQNLHDHPNVPVFFRCKGEVDCHYPQLYSFYRTLPQAPLPMTQSR